MLDKEGERLVDGPRLDQVVVVEDEDRVSIQVREIVQQGGQDRLYGRRLRGAINARAVSPEPGRSPSTAVTK